MSPVISHGLLERIVFDAYRVGYHSVVCECLSIGFHAGRAKTGTETKCGPTDRDGGTLDVVDARARGGGGTIIL